MVHPLKCGVIAWRGIVRQGWFLREPDQGYVHERDHIGTYAKLFLQDSLSAWVLNALDSGASDA